MMKLKKFQKSVSEFIVSERGDTNFISIILIVAIVVALAAIFFTMANGGMETVNNLFSSALNSFGG